VETSCWGYTDANQQVVQFTAEHLLDFGRELSISVAKHLHLNEEWREMYSSGLDIDLDFGLSEVHKKWNGYFKPTPSYKCFFETKIEI
jgi:hypothetical protein